MDNVAVGATIISVALLLFILFLFINHKNQGTKILISEDSTFPINVSVDGTNIGDIEKDTAGKQCDLECPTGSHDITFKTSYQSKTHHLSIPKNALLEVRCTEIEMICDVKQIQTKLTSKDIGIYIGLTIIFVSILILAFLKIALY